MFPIKAIKIGLPVATATSAAIATTSLVSFSKKDEIQKEEDLDKELSDLSMPDEKYEDKELFYSKDGDGKNQEVLDKELAEKLSKLLKEKGDLSSIKGPTPNLSKIDLENVMENAPTSRGEGVEHNKQQNSNPPEVKGDEPQGTTDQSYSSEVGASTSLDEGKALPQTPVATEESNTEFQGSVGSDDEKHGGAGDKEQFTDLGKQASGLEDAKTMHVDDDLKQEGEGPQESQPSSIGGGPEAKDTEDPSTSSLQGDLTDNVTQTEAGSKEHGKDDFEGDVRSDSSDAILGGQDDDSTEQKHKGTDSVGNGKEFTEEDLKKLGELGDQLSSVSSELMSLISD